MLDEVKLIYLYQLKGKGFRSNDPVENQKYLETICIVTDGLQKEYLKQYRKQNLTPLTMSKLMLQWLCSRGSI